VGQPKRNKIKRKRHKNKDGTFTKSGFICRLMEAGWTMKEALEEYKRIRRGDYDEC